MCMYMCMDVSEQYVVAILMSLDMHDLMSDEGREHCRSIGKVTVKES